MGYTFESFKIHLPNRTTNLSLPMQQNFFYLLLLLVVPWLVFSQNEKVINGTVMADNMPMEGVHVLNLNTEKATATNQKGEFQITVRVGDLLTFTAVNLDFWRKSVDEKSFADGSLLIKMTQKTTSLDEVVVTEYTRINAQDLGIINYTPKKYTPAERRLRTAGDFKWYSPLLIPFGGMPLDGLINKISGRTNKLKKELQVEQKEKRLEKLTYLYDDDFFTNVLAIPGEYVGGFKYYAIENEALVLVLNEKNKLKASFLLGEIAQEYLILIKDEK